MRIEPTFGMMPKEPSANPTRQRGPDTSYPSTLTSPHAPKWGEKVLAFFRWIFSFFTWYLPAKKEEPIPTAPPPEFVLAVKKAKEAELANQNPIPGLIKGLIIQRFMFYLMGRPVEEFYTSVSIQATRYCVDKIANYLFPEISELKKKVGSLALSNAIIWMGSKHFNYPFNWVILAPQAINIYMLYQKSSAEAAQKRQARLAQLVANN